MSAAFGPITPVTVLLAAVAVGVWGLALLGSGRSLAMTATAAPAAAAPSAVVLSGRTSRALALVSLTARRSVVATAWAAVAAAVLLFRRGPWARLAAAWLSTPPPRGPSALTSAPDAALAAAETLLTAAASRRASAAAAVDATATTLRGLRVEVEAWVADVDGEAVSVASSPSVSVPGSHGASAAGQEAAVEAAARAAGEAMARQRLRWGARQREAAALRRRLADVGARIAAAVRLLLPEQEEGAATAGRITLRAAPPPGGPLEGATDGGDGGAPDTDGDDGRPMSAAAEAVVQRQAAMAAAVAAAAAALPSLATTPITPPTSPGGLWARGAAPLRDATHSPPSLADSGSAAAAAADRKRVVAAASRSVWSSRADTTRATELVAALNEMAAWRSAPYEERSRQIRAERTAVTAARVAQAVRREGRAGSGTAESGRRLSTGGASSVDGGGGGRTRRPSGSEGGTSPRRTELASPSAPHLSRSGTAVLRLPHLPLRRRRGGSERGANDRLGVGATASPPPVAARGADEGGGGGGGGGGSSHSGESSVRSPTTTTPLRKLWRRARPSEPLLPLPPMSDSDGTSFRGAAADPWAGTTGGDGAAGAAAGGQSDAPALAVDGWAPPPPPPPPPSPPMVGEGGSGDGGGGLGGGGGGGGGGEDGSGLSAAIRRARVGAWLRSAPTAAADTGARESGGSSTLGGGSGRLLRLRRGGGTGVPRLGSLGRGDGPPPPAHEEEGGISVDGRVGGRGDAGYGKRHGGVVRRFGRTGVRMYVCTQQWEALGCQPDEGEGIARGVVWWPRAMERYAGGTVRAMPAWEPRAGPLAAPAEVREKRPGCTSGHDGGHDQQDSTAP